jgi:hypothetical protein
MKNLSYEEFQKTFGKKMLPIDFDVELLKIELEFSDIIYTEPEGAFRNNTNTFEHHLLKTVTERVFLVFVKNLENNNIDYHVLDLNEKYGLN